MTKRSEAEKKKSSTMFSPFNERDMSVTDKLSNDENKMYQWLISYSDDNE